MRNANAAKEEMKQVDDLNQLGPPTKQLLPYDEAFKVNCGFHSSCNPDLIEEALVLHLRDREQIDAEVN